MYIQRSTLSMKYFKIYIYVQSVFIFGAHTCKRLRHYIILVYRQLMWKMYCKIYSSQMYDNLWYTLSCSIFIRDASLDDGKHNTTQQTQLVHISFGNTNMLGINIFSLRKTTLQLLEKNIVFLHQNSFAIIIQSCCFAGLLMLQQHIWF